MNKKSICQLSGIIAALAITLGIGLAVDLNSTPDYVSNPRMIYGTCEWYSTYQSGTTVKDSYKYSDDWFFGKAADRNDDLALVSMQLSAASITNELDGAGAKFLNDLGFNEVGMTDFASDDPEDFNYTWGRKTIGRGFNKYTLVAVVVQSYTFDSAVKDKGWVQNFTVNGSEATDEHYSFKKAADKMIDSIVQLGKDGNVKFWVMGQSRAGAIANVVGARLKDRTGGKSDRVYTYTFEAPNTVSSSAVPNNSSDYAYIHNYTASDDIVAMVPMWDMTVYGTRHYIDTADVDEGLAQKMTEMAVPAAAEMEGYNHDKNLETADRIITNLTAAVPTRAEYSQVRNDKFTYTYQDTFVNLMHVIFSGETKVDAEALTSQMNDLIPCVDHLFSAVKNNNDDEYYEAAVLVKKFFDDNGQKIGLSETDYYALFKLAGGIIIKTDYVPEPGEDEAQTMLGRIAPLFDIAVSAKNLTLSHQFDTTIARLKMMSADPSVDKVDITVSAPKAGDELLLTPSAVSSSGALLRAVDARGRAWLTSSSKWLTSDASLEDNKVYYLDVTLTSVGHKLTSATPVTINGNLPVEPLTVTYKDGTYIAHGVWEFVIGTPSDVNVSFDAQGISEAPAAVKVPYGTMMKYTKLPDLGTYTQGDLMYRHNGWVSSDGRSSDDVTVTGDITLQADWINLINKIEITFNVPGMGESVPEATTPDGAHYRMSSSYATDSEYNNVETIAKPDNYYLVMCLELADDKSDYLFHMEGEDQCIYDGEFYVNGVKYSAEDLEMAIDLESETHQMILYYYFDVKAAAGEAPQTEGAETENTETA